MRISEKKAAKAVAAYFQKVSHDAAAAQMHLTGTGPVAELERKIKRHYSTKYALCLSNGTTALTALALALELKNSDFVTTPYTYGATVSGWMMLGNKPVFADIDGETLALDCRAAAKAVTSRTKAVLAADIYGIPHDSQGMRKIADEHGLWYIADCAQSLGATRYGAPSGILADALVVSFTAGKTLFAGEGAAVATNNETIYEKLLWITQHPLRQKKELGLDLYNEFGLNARIHPLAAVWACAVWPDALKKLAAHQRDCYEIIAKLNDIGLTETISFMPEKINPSFCRLTAVWKNCRPEKAILEKELSDCIGPTIIEDGPVRLLFQQPSFGAQYKKGDWKKFQCLQAERQVKSRFCIITHS